MAFYPNQVAVFTTKVNNTDTVDASHPNSIQSEVVATQSILGENPHISTTPSSSGTFTSVSTTFATLNARLENIETGIVADTHTQYLKKSGGGTITSSSSSAKPLIVKGASSQTANLQEWQNSSGTAVAYVDASGALVDSKMTADINNLYVLNYVFG